MIILNIRVCNRNFCSIMLTNKFIQITYFSLQDNIKHRNIWKIAPLKFPLICLASSMAKWSTSKKKNVFISISFPSLTCMKSKIPNWTKWVSKSKAWFNNQNFGVVLTLIISFWAKKTKDIRISRLANPLATIIK